jgi:hypothetical protein
LLEELAAHTPAPTSQAVHGLAQTCLSPVPSDRPSMAEVAAQCQSLANGFAA